MLRHIHEPTVSICGFRSVILPAGVEAQDQDKPATPAEQHQALPKELQGSAAAYFQTTNATEQKAIVARVDKAAVKLLERIEQYPKEPFAVAALTQIITQEYWLNTHTSHPGCCFATISTAISSSRRARGSTLVSVGNARRFYPKGVRASGGRGTPTPPFICPDGVSRHWRLEYHPDGNGGTGSITVTLNGQAVTLNLDPGHKQVGAWFNRFGIITTHMGAIRRLVGSCGNAAQIAGPAGYRLLRLPGMLQERVREPGPH